MHVPLLYFTRYQDVKFSMVMWAFHAVVLAREEVLNRIESVMYLLHPSYPNTVQVATYRLSWFKLKELRSGLGTTTLCCPWIVGPLASMDHNAIYPWSGPASTLFIPALLDFCCVWLLFTPLLLAAQGAGRRAAAIPGSDPLFFCLGLL
jgi:hypothetical protein